MKKTVIGVLSLALLAGAVPLAASDTGNDEAQSTRGPGKGNRMAHFQAQLGLSDEQVEQIRSIRQEGGSRDDVRAVLTEEQRANALKVLNRRFETDFEIDAFEHVALYDAEQEWIEMRLRALRPTSVSLGGTRRLRFDTGDVIRTEISRKFTRESFVAALEGTGLELSEWFTDPDELFASALVRPIGDRESS